MFFVTYEQNGQEYIGVLTADKEYILPLPGTMIEFVAQGEQAVERAAAKLAKAENCPDKVTVESVRLKAPIPRPAKNIFCIGKNYVEHAMEFDKTADPNIAVPKNPVIFTKAPTTVIGPEQAIDSHSHLTSALDYEVELAVVIGKKAKGVSREEAMDYVFGYTIFNDVTARDLQKRHLQWFRGKSMDTFGPMGPYLVHKSAIMNPGQLSVMSKVNGEVRQNANTKDFIFDIPTLISTIAAGITLEPGDIIATGTPAGVGGGFNPPKFMKPGDVVECVIDGIGVLKNTVK